MGAQQCQHVPDPKEKHTIPVLLMLAVAAVLAVCADAAMLAAAAAVLAVAAVVLAVGRGDGGFYNEVWGLWVALWRGSIHNYTYRTTRSILDLTRNAEFAPSLLRRPLLIDHGR